MGGEDKNLETLLLGSSPLASAEDFFTKVSDCLCGALHQIPDGETGSRGNFIAWQHGNLPITIVQPRWGGQPSAASSAKTYSLDDIKSTGYDDHPSNSCHLFRQRKATGKIEPHVRFQVCLPSPLGVIRGFVEDDGVCAQVDPLYEQRILQSINRIQENIPADQISLQFDLPFEIAMMEYERGRIQDKYSKPYFSPVKAGITERLIRLAKVIDPKVEIGFHLCYGDFGHQHFVQPSDMGLLVDLANAIVVAVEPHHRITYFHMPVPHDRTDAEYFLPLKGLELRNAKLFLGVIHAHDEPGTKARLQAARKAFPDVAGISTECGMGRTPKEDFESILELSKHLAGSEAFE